MRPTTREDERSRRATSDPSPTRYTLQGFVSYKLQPLIFCFYSDSAARLARDLNALAGYAPALEAPWASAVGILSQERERAFASSPALFWLLDMLAPS